MGLNREERDGEAARRMSGISRRSVKNRSQVTKQSGKKQKHRNSDISIEMPETVREINRDLEEVFGVNLAAVYSDVFDYTENLAITRANRVKKPKVESTKQIMKDIENLDINELF